MTKDSLRNKPDPVYVKHETLTKRKHFITYNIVRLRELIRYLPEEKLELFHTIPLLLHMNSPDLPGYVDHPMTPHGIYRFFDSGFWKLANTHLRAQGKEMPSLMSKSFCIRGIYLMGSSGTVGQTDYSDFDYWVVIDRGSVSKMQRALLREKLAKIKDWAKETYGHNLSLFLLDFEQIQQNDFSGIDQQSSGTAQKSLLKAEFYRTFIMIAGQIPFWAVLPAGLNDAEYKGWIETASLLSDDDFVPDDYVDLGNLTAIESDECLGAVLWQICKAKDDPPKSLIKAALLAHHYFFQEQEGMLCNIIKKKFPERRLDSYLLDPYTLAFERAVAFYEAIDDEDGLDLIRQCIYLRLTGYSVPTQLDENNPKRQILNRYAKEWSWDADQIAPLESYRLWTEEEKLQFEDRIIDKLSFLYELIFRSSGKHEPFMGMAFEDLTALKNITASHFKKKPGKLPHCSAYLRAKRETCSLFIAYQQDSSGANVWVVYDRSAKGSKEEDEVPLFVAPELLHVLGWTILNGLHKGTPSSIVFQHVQSPISVKHAERLLEELIRFFSNDIPLKYMSSDPAWLKVFVALDAGPFPADNTLRSVGYLVQNTWGEMFFYSLELTHIENNFLRCYEIAKRLRRYLQKAAPGESDYYIYPFRSTGDDTTIRTIEDFIKSLQKTGKGDLKAQEAGTSATQCNGRRRPLLDLL